MGRRVARARALDIAQWRVVAASLVLVPAVRASLHLRGFGPTARVLARLSDRPASGALPRDPRSAAAAVAVVAGRSVVGTRCLGRSLVLWFLLRRRGVDAELVIGAAPPGGGSLHAHAWVEVAGEPVNDEPDVRARFGSFDLPLPRLTARAEP